MSDNEVTTLKRSRYASESDEEVSVKKSRDSERLYNAQSEKQSKSEKYPSKDRRKHKERDYYDEDRERDYDNGKQRSKYDDRRRDKYEDSRRRDKYDEKRRDKYEDKREREEGEDRRRDKYDRNRKRDKYVDLDYYDDTERTEYNKEKYKSYYRAGSSPPYEPEPKYPRYYADNEEETNKKENNKKDTEKENDKKGSEKENKDELNKETMTKREKKTVDLLTSKTGGAYIPPAKLRMMQAQITDKSSAAYQRIAWEALKKSIHGFINKVNTGNIALITKELLRENIVRGRGLLCKSIIQAQAASPTFTHVYAALVALINVKFPSIGELLLKRLVLQFKRSFKRNDKSNCIAAAAFIAHLVNQRVAHEILALEILTLLVESPTDDSVEVAIAFLKECGQKLVEVSPKGINAIFEMLRNILHEGQLDKRIQYMIEVVFQVRKDGFKDHAAITEELDLVEEEDQFTHLITLEDVKDGQEILSKLSV